jgi:lipoate---protein ligase
MRYLINESTNPCFNLTFYENSLMCLETQVDFIFLWLNESESGVYHDFDNLNFTFNIILNNNVNTHYKRIIQPNINTLKAIDLKSKYSKQNDTLFDGYKISWHVQRLTTQKSKDHEILLYNTNFDFLTNAMQIPHDKYTTRGVKPVCSKVTNLKVYLPHNHSIFDFWKSLHFFLSN